MLMALLMAAIGVWRIIVVRGGIRQATPAALVIALFFIPAFAAAQDATVTGESGATYTVSKDSDGYEVENGQGRSRWPDRADGRRGARGVRCQRWEPRYRFGFPGCH